MQLPSNSDESGGADTTGSEFPDTLAAVDLGSNSFHMVVAVPSMACIKVVDHLREPVRLGTGLRPDGILSEDAQQRAWCACAASDNGCGKCRRRRCGWWAPIRCSLPSMPQVFCAPPKKHWVIPST